MNNPKENGRYLACVFEWTGAQSAKPDKPRWEIKTFTREQRINPKTMRWEIVSENWERVRYTYDTGGWENFELVAWQGLPPLPNT